MADSREPFAWREALLYCYTGNSSAIVAYAENLELQVTRSITKFLYPTTGVGYAARTQYVETDKNVTLNIGALFAGQSFYAMLQSGANISATVNFLTSADGASSTFIIWSAQMPDFGLQGTEGGIWKQKIKIIGPDCSGI